jgi:hypothetical protein
MRSLLNSKGSLSPWVSTIWSNILLLVSGSKSESCSGGRFVFDDIDACTGTGSVANTVDGTSKSVIDSVEDSSGQRGYAIKAISGSSSLSRLKILQPVVLIDEKQSGRR